MHTKISPTYRELLQLGRELGQLRLLDGVHDVKILEVVWKCGTQGRQSEGLVVREYVDRLESRARGEAEVLEHPRVIGPKVKFPQCLRESACVRGEGGASVRRWRR